MGNERVRNVPRSYPLQGHHAGEFRQPTSDQEEVAVPPRGTEELPQNVEGDILKWRM